MKRILAVFLLLAVTLPAGGSRVRAVRPGVSEPQYLEAARGVAAWLETLEIRRPGGEIAWPPTQAGGTVWPGLENGAAGIGTFHLKLYQVTREPRYLEKAEGAAAYVRDRYRAGESNGHDWLAGMTGGGEFFVTMYRETGAERHRTAVVEVADALLGRALRDEPGVHWQHPGLPKTYTGLAHGAAGVGLFLVHAFEITKDPRYLEAARDAVVWLDQHRIALDAGSIGWKRLTSDRDAVHTWCGGTIGVVHFLRELHRVTGEARYAELAARGLDGLLHEAVTVQPNEQKAWRYSSSGGGGFILVHCHGGTSNATLLARAAVEDGDVRYRDAAEAAGRWLDAVAAPRPAGASWTQGHSWLIGNASIGHASLQLYAANRTRHHLDRARRAADYLLSVADHPGTGQVRWAGDGTGLARFETGWYYGAAGIGIFLLELHESLAAPPSLAPLSPLNP